MMKQNYGFTLIELLVVVAIMLILATVGFSNFTFSIKKSHDAVRKQDLATIAKGLEAYASDWGDYPASGNGGTIKGCDFNGAGLVDCAWGEDPFAAYLQSGGAVITYLAKLPGDPTPGQSYYYEKTATGYNLYAALENTSDPSYKGGIAYTCGDVTCNYQVSQAGVQ